MNQKEIGAFKVSKNLSYMFETNEIQWQYKYFTSGRDTWRLTTETETHSHTYYVPPGEFGNLTKYIPEHRINSISKVHPNTQYYTGNTDSQEPFAPVASNQMEEGTKLNKI